MKSKNLDLKKESTEESTSGVLFEGKNESKKKSAKKVENNEVTEEVEVESENEAEINVPSEEESTEPILSVENDVPPPRVRQVKLSNKKPRRKMKKFLRIFFIFLIAFILIFAGFTYFFIVAPAQRVVSYADDMKSNGVQMLKDFEGKDLSNIDSYFDNIQNDLTKIDGEINNFDFLATLPATKGYYDNFQVAREILRKTSELIEETLPDFKDVLKVTGFKTDKDQPAPSTKKGAKEDGALTLVLKEMPRYLGLYNEMEPKIIDILADVKKLDLDYIPNVGDYQLKDAIQSTYDSIDEFPDTSAKVTNFLRYVPDLVGAKTPAKFLLVLQNETEMRSSGGLLTAYGFLTFNKGEFDDDIFLTDMWNFQYDLWSAGRPMPYNNIYGQSYLMNLGCGGSELRVQDAGIYPDLYRVGTMLQAYYKQVQPVFPDKYPPYNYILFLNEHFATELINIIQPLKVKGYGTVTGENLYEFIKGETDQQLPNDVRKKIIKDIANAAKEKFFNLPVEKFSEVITTIIGSFQRRDLAIEAPNSTKIQKYLDTYGMSGRMETTNSFKGDYFHLNEAQNCSLKLNKFIRDEVTQNVNIQKDGSIKRDVTVKWLQTKVYEEGLDKQYSPTLSFSYRAWTRFMTPKGSTNFNSDGYLASGYVGYYPQNYYDTVMNKQINDNIIQFDHRRFSASDPVERGDMHVSYDLPTTINYKKDKSYNLLIQKHNGKSWGEKYTINIANGKEKSTVTFTLDRDKVLKYKNGIITVSNYDKSLDWLSDLAQSIPWDKISSSDK